jgi:hypothetical protein
MAEGMYIYRAREGVEVLELCRWNDMNMRSALLMKFTVRLLNSVK